MPRSYAPSDDGYSHYSASSPASYANDDAPQRSSLRKMRLKVLYTCDDRSNCMAKWFQTIDVYTAFLDERTEIGVVELKTCIRAIVTCSPELVAKLGQDYTVYAYDYSEHETPLVGQGMLSWVLASASPTPSAPAQQSRTMVTGRVTRNLKTLFTRDDIDETLEVKLRLVPVPTILQSEYIESMGRYRDISRIMPVDFDNQAWTEFLQSNPQVLSVIGQGRHESPQQRGAAGSNVGIEQVQRLMQRTQSYSQRPPTAMTRRDSLAGSVYSRNESRAGSPTPSTQAHTQDSFASNIVRPSSQASARSLRRTLTNEAVDDPELMSNDERQEEGPARKRARTTQVRRPRKNDVFGSQADSLRVVASGAASVRVLQPTAIRPGIVSTNSLEEPPRVPTPVPQNPGFATFRLAPKPRRSGLGQAVSSIPPSDPALVLDDPPQLRQALSPDGRATIASSPGDDPGSSPPDPPSRRVSVVPSSPQLPRMPPPHQDSGFMSGTMEDEFSDIKQAQPSVESEQPSFEPEPLTSEPPKPRSRARQGGAKRPRADSTNAQMTDEEKKAELSRRNARKAIRLGKENTYSPAWTKNPKNKYPRGRLVQAVDAGKLPPYCENCGDIETSTWRRAFTRIYHGSPDNVVITKNPGGVLAVEIVEQDADGNVSLFRVVKKSLLEDDKDFDQMLLCNPCGLWLVNKRSKTMRPPEKWTVGAKQKTGEPRSGSGHPRQLKALERGRSITAAPSEATEPPSELNTPAFESEIDPRLRETYRDLVQTDAPEPEEEPELPKLPEEPARPLSKGSVKARSDNTVPAVAVAALQRAIQSSPGHLRGSKHSPIDLDNNTPDRTRRTLFPSPKTAGPLRATNGNGLRHSLQNSPDVPKQFSFAKSAEANKENVDGTAEESSGRPATPSPNNEFDGLHDLFNEPLPPATPSRGNNIHLPLPKSPSNFFKTPSKQTPHRGGLGTGDFFGASAMEVLHPPRTPSRTPAKRLQQTPNAETPFTKHINQLLSEPVVGGEFDINTSPSALFAEFGNNFTDFAMSTDLPMPSSPPVDGPAKSRLADAWSDLGITSSPFKGAPTVSKVKEEAVDEVGSADQHT